MQRAPALKICSLWPLLVMALDAGAPAAESQMLTDIPGETVATESKLLVSTQQTRVATETGSDAEAYRQAVAQYQNSINELQKTHGAYYDRIGEALAGLGLAYKNLGQYPEALTAFNRSLQISRVNYGLHNLEQLPILEQIIATNTARSDWAALDQNYQYLYWVYRRSYGATDPRLLPVIDRLASRHLNAYTLATDPQSFNHLLTADVLYHDAITIIETTYGAYDQRLINPLYGIAMTNYQIAFHAYNLGDFKSLHTSTRNPYRMEQMFEEEQAIQDYISAAYRAGKQALLSVIEIYVHTPGLPATDHAVALIHLGDWYLLFNRRTSANDTYALANTMLTDSGMHQDEINQLFARPRSLPALQMPAVNQQEEVKKDNDSNYVLAKFDVSESGLARNIKILEAHPAADESIQRRVKDTISVTRFRPRLEDGQPVETTNVNIRYVLQE